MRHVQPEYTDCANCGTADHASYACQCGCHNHGAAVTARHTPEPWHVNAIANRRIVGDDTTTHDYDYLEICNANATIARVYRAKDARLIATAPELAAALAACLPDLERYASTHGPGPDRRRDAARAALAKAGLA